MEIIAENKQLRKDLDVQLQVLKDSNTKSRERNLCITKLQEAIMWLGMDLKRINEECPNSSPNPYPESYNPESKEIEPTADGLKM